MRARKREVPEMSKKRRLFTLLAGVVAVALCGLVTAPALAHEVVDMSRKGSVSVSMTYEGEPVGGGALSLYRVGDVAEDDGNFSFALTDEFAGSGVSLDDVTSADLASSLADYATAQGVEADGTYEIAADGTMKASGLELGLYLVVQGEPAEGYEPCAPFLVSVPMNEGGAYVYDVDATPKVEPGGLAPQELVEEETPTPGTSAETEKDLPTTGDVTNYVPVIACVGVGVVLVGCALAFHRHGKNRAE